MVSLSGSTRPSDAICASSAGSCGRTSRAIDQQAQQVRFVADNVRRAVDEMRAKGFAAIYVNRNGFPDRGKGLEEALLALGYEKPPIRNATGDLACFILQ